MATAPVKKTITCPLCRSAAHRAHVKFGRDFFSCSACGLGFIHPPPDPEEIRSLYDQSYYDPWGISDADGATERMKKATFHDKLEVIERFSSGKGRILDIGCATGYFLDAAKERGWDVHGVELSEYSSGIARNKLGNDRVFTGTVEEADFEDNFFDAVVMTDVLEHITDVHSFTEEVARILKPGGISAITTPDPHTASCRLMGAHWPHYKLEHLLYFSPRALLLLMEPLGFTRLYLASATKTLTFAYLSLQMRSYPIPVVTQLTNLLAKVLPDSLQNAQIRLFSGELFDISRLDSGSPS
jgi:SAM-dependent methyltransferase